MKYNLVEIVGDEFTWRYKTVVEDIDLQVGIEMIKFICSHEPNKNYTLIEIRD